MGVQWRSEARERQGGNLFRRRSQALMRTLLRSPGRDLRHAEGQTA